MTLLETKRLRISATFYPRSWIIGVWRLHKGWGDITSDQNMNTWFIHPIPLVQIAIWKKKASE